NKFALLHGQSVNPAPLEDAKSRVFGTFFGTGIDRDGAVVTPASFARFNSRGRSFDSDLEDYLSSIAGRFILLLDTGAKTRVYRDPMGHMPLFFNPDTGLAGSSISLTIDRPVTGNTACAKPGSDPASAKSFFPMGQTVDRDVRLLPGNHLLDLSDMTARRTWPLRKSIRKVTAAKSAPVMDKIAARLRDIVQGWIATDDVVLPLDASAGSRILMAAAGDMRGDLAQITVLQQGDAGDAKPRAVAQNMTEAVGVPLTPLTRDAAIATLGGGRPQRVERKRLFWLRTSSAMRIRTQDAYAIDALQPSQHIVLNASGLDALQGGWQAGGPKPKPIRASLTAQIEATLGFKPEKPVRTAVEEDYTRWKSTLPKTLQDAAEDFIRIELHEPPKAVITLGHAEHVHASPFSDRTVIELALKLPLSLRSSPKFAEALIEALDPALAGLPYDAPLMEPAAAE
ncbi:MAG: hypothetical protein AAF317_04455, partial [Pseudomonadota bacterium]